MPEHTCSRFWGRYLDAAGLDSYKRAESVKPVGRHGNADRYSVDPGAITHDVAVYTAQAESVVPEGQQSNGDRYSVASVSTDSATGKPRYATASRIQKWSHDGVHGSPSRQNTENPHPTRIR